jgi:hypothetical protein
MAGCPHLLGKTNLAKLLYCPVKMTCGGFDVLKKGKEDSIFYETKDGIFYLHFYKNPALWWTQNLSHFDVAGWLHHDL